ncbi:unnamed protein product [Prunus armeniaca]
MVAKISMFWAGVRRARRARRARRSLGGVKVGARRSRRALRLEKKNAILESPRSGKRSRWCYERETER